ncbi:MAG: metallophosphoesterase [Cyclobacteriaceae bacterium]|nr:metallophosphoesterase [Cyclobacteriaceae bacterium]
MDKNSRNNTSVSFGIVADLQYCDAPPTINRYYRKAPDKLKNAIEEFNRHNLDFVINLGDLIDQDWKSFDGILPLFELFKAPVYHVLGNHDYEVEDRYKPEVHKKLETQKYYDFSMENWRFIVLDGNDISTFANLENSGEYQKADNLLKEMELEHKVNANFWNGGIGEKQLNWLNQILEDAWQKHQKSIIFCHFPVYPEHRHNLLNDLELLNVIEKYDCVKAWFNGHNHDGNYGLINNVHFVNVKGMVDTEFDTAFCIVQLSDDTIKINGFGTEISAKLNF